jgi:hypothetical protein
MIPATFASASTRPLVLATTAATPSAVATSAVTGISAGPGFWAVSSLSRVSEMSAATTVAPSRASRSTVARPMPEPAPVTMAVFPANRPETVSVLVLMAATSPISRACRCSGITLRQP